ncbi:MAG: pilus assembly protein PilM [Candidatus Kaiserbacteria bacterium]|nr:pilus assembly protein PilM [Candidatus Kaiserbacteria bacterium]
MSFVFGDRLRAAFAPPRYLVPPLSGVDISTSGVKVVRLESGVHGLVLAAHSQVRLPLGVFTDGEIIDHEAIVGALSTATEAAGISAANVSLPESKAYLFEAVVQGTTKAEWRTIIEQRLDELVPLPPQETAFDIVGVGPTKSGEQSIVGVGFARRVVDETLSVFDQANIPVRALEEETFAMTRALLPSGDTSTVLIIDVGKTTTKMAIVTGRVPRFATTFGIGGHALTLAVQKHFGVTEADARKVKVERGIIPAPGNEEYLAAMLSTASAIRDEISRRLEYWQEKEALNGVHEKVTRVILSGGNASIRGFSEYLESSLRIPVSTGDVFTNFASRDTWIPSLDYAESLAYATAIGLALRDTVDMS